MKKKIVVVGSGSLLFTPGIIKDCLLSKYLNESELVLYDPNQELSSLMYKYGLRLKEEIKSGLKIKVEKNRKKALNGADFVFLSINVGGFACHKQDIGIPLSFGILQSVGDTVGPGGVFRTLRFVPAVIDIGKDMEKVCPTAILLTYTNPMTSICQAVYKYTKIRAMGMCHDFMATVNDIAELAKVPFETITTNYAGLNHCVWILDIKSNGKSLKPVLDEYAKNSRYPEKMKCRFDLYKLFGFMPGGGEKHVVEFFPYYLRKEVNYKKIWNLELRLDALVLMMKDRKIKYERIVKAIKGEPVKDLFEPSGEKGTAVIESIMNNTPKIYNLNVLNNGCVSNMPDDSVLELPTLVNANGPNGIYVGNIPDSVYWNVLSQSIKLKLAVEASVEKDRKKAFQALIAEPMIGNINDAKEIFNKMIKAQPEYLGYLK
ncbi:MAG: hypothetical protein ABH873_06320 [Candidatus Firestonebacteria bacterium]